MIIKWYGQAYMALESDSGVKVVCDPYDRTVGYRLPEENADIVTVSHDHHDHNAVDNIKGTPRIIRNEQAVDEKGIRIRSVHTWHDTEKGAKRGSNNVFKFEIDNIHFVHMGDIGHILTQDQINAIKPCDILAVPVGGVFTVDGNSARKIVEQLEPQIVIPIHYHTLSNKLGLNTEDEFLKHFIELRRGKQWEGMRSDIPGNVVVHVLMAQGENKGEDY